MTVLSTWGFASLCLGWWVTGTSAFSSNPITIQPSSMALKEKMKTGKFAKTTQPKASSQLWSSADSTSSSSKDVDLLDLSTVTVQTLDGEEVNMDELVFDQDAKVVCLSCLSHFGDFNAWELTQQYIAAVKAERIESPILLVGIGSVEAANKFAEDLGLANSEDEVNTRITILADEKGAANDALGCYKGWLAVDVEHRERYPYTDINPYLKLFGMIFGFGSPGTISKVLYGYTGDSSNSNGSFGRKWVVDALLQGSEAGRFPTLTKAAFDGVPSESALRAFELATLRLQTGLHIVFNWSKLGPENEDLFTRMGGTFIFNNKRKCIYSFWDQGILSYADIEEICGVVIENGGGKRPPPFFVVKPPTPEEEAEMARVKKEEEMAKIRAEEEARLQREAEEAARLEAERIKAEEEAKQKAEEEARLKAEEEAQLKAEEEAKLKAEEEAQLKAEEEAQQKAEVEEEARLEAEETEMAEEPVEMAEEPVESKEEEEARLLAEEEAWLEAELKAEEEAAEAAQKVPEEEVLKDEEQVIEIPVNGYDAPAAKVDDKETSKRKEKFQRALLGTRLQLEKVSNDPPPASGKKDSGTVTSSGVPENFQEALLRARLQFEKASKNSQSEGGTSDQTGSKPEEKASSPILTKELFQRKLLEARIRTEKMSKKRD